VRKNIKDLLHQIAELTSTDLTTLLEPLKQSILGTLHSSLSLVLPPFFFCKRQV
jgi:hypothetical protein